MVRFALRIIAGLTAFAVVMTVPVVLRFTTNGGIAALLGTGVFGLLTVLGWLLTLLVGPFAAVQLWRLRPSGRRVTAFLAAYTTIYYAAGLVFFPGPGAKVAVVVFMLAISAAASVFLLSGHARVQCDEAAREMAVRLE